MTLRQNKIQIIKYAPPPSDLPVYGNVDSAQVSFIGRTNYVASLEEKKFIFGIKRVDRRRHLYIIGKSGVGKSKIQELFVRQDIAYGYGVCVIDPHGEFIDDILNFIPEERIDDVCVIDPSDVDFPVSFNPLQNVDPTFKHQLTQGLIEVLSKQFGSNWTPRLEHVFRFTTLALLDYPHATMRGMISMLTDRNYRQKVVEYIEDDMVKRFWAIEFADWSEKFDTDAIIPLVNKLGQLLSNPTLRSLVRCSSQKSNKLVWLVQNLPTRIDMISICMWTSFKTLLLIHSKTFFLRLVNTVLTSQSRTNMSDSFRPRFSMPFLETSEQLFVSVLVEKTRLHFVLSLRQFSISKI